MTKPFRKPQTMESIVFHAQPSLMKMSNTNISSERLANKVLSYPHDMTTRVEMEKVRAQMAIVFFLPIQSIRKMATTVPGNSANVVQIKET